MVEQSTPSSTRLRNRVDSPPAANTDTVEKLADEQRIAVEVCCNLQEARPVMLVGAAGTGKSVTVRRIMRTLREQKVNASVAGPTAMAAELVGGVTVHALVGLLGDQGGARQVR